MPDVPPKISTRLPWSLWMYLYAGVGVGEVMLSEGDAVG